MRSEFRLFLLVSLGLQQAVSQRSIWIGEEPEVRDECAPDSPYRIQIREGDCLSMLAEASSTSVDRWMTFNPRIADNNWLDVGWNLCAPAGASPIRNLKKCGPAPPETILQLKTTTQPFQPVPFAFRTTISPNRNHDETTLTEVIGGIIQCIFLANHIAECQDECSEETSIVYLTPLVKMEKRACHGKTSVSHNWDFSDGTVCKGLMALHAFRLPVTLPLTFHGCFDLQASFRHQG
ncbi:hypothetical protein RvY_08609-2 [Ramazzottius varieornatus]|uniref:LysM domain-containing protein n=1 Tax=Ramazzottius varieornatus TaxID=947166 RepID=A0A1D1V6F5_RAMVA|nr:hypothetical protein RvY_08609-2 [Ramazzottius varieornatus]